MAIELNPNAINISPGSAGRSQPPTQEVLTAEPKTRAFKPANLNIIPSEESLQTQIRSAVANKRAGNVVDRGSILNLLV